MTVGELRAELAKYPDDMPVVGVYDEGSAAGVIRECTGADSMIFGDAVVAPIVDELVPGARTALTLIVDQW